MCKGYGVVFCFAKSPLPATPSLTHQSVPALWQLWRLSLKRLNRLFTAEIKKTVISYDRPDQHNTHFSLSVVYADLFLTFSLTLCTEYTP